MDEPLTILALLSKREWNVMEGRHQLYLILLFIISAKSIYCSKVMLQHSFAQPRYLLAERAFSFLGWGSQMLQVMPCLTCFARYKSRTSQLTV